MWFPFFVIFVFLFKNVICVNRIDPLVSTNVGLIRGVAATDGDYSMFLGIPFGRLDEQNPFGHATAYPPFETPFQAYEESQNCAQDNHGILLGGLDCLALNVYVPPSATSTNRLPVMVYIHGGSFRHKHGYAGRATQSPKYLVKNDVIVVTINYRIGVYGFICLDTPKAPGNQGLKDQYLALQWVKNNIEAFGGNPNEITLFGLSSGGHSIDFQLIANKEKLFNKIILESGSAQAGTVLYDPDKEAALKIASILGFETTDTDEALSFLSNTNSDLVVTAATDSGIVFKPCIESQNDDVEPFITSQWIDTNIPNVKDMPVLLGFNKYEMAAAHFYQDSQYFDNLNIVSDYLNRTFNFNEEELTEMESLVSHYYFGDENISEGVKWDVIRFDSDFTYIHPIQRTLKSYLNNEAGNIYYYMFSYIGSRNELVTEDDSATLCCASHADELQYIFVNQLGAELTATDELVIERITTMWTNFAHYSDPTPVTSDLLPVKWTPVTKDNYYYMNIGEDLILKQRPHHERMAFWDLFYEHNKNAQRHNM